jgi:putative ABC transport system permease protein
VGTAVGLGTGVAQVAGTGAQLTVADPTALGRVLALGVVLSPGAPGLGWPPDEPGTAGTRRRRGPIAAS